MDDALSRPHHPISPAAAPAALLVLLVLLAALPAAAQPAPQELPPRQPSAVFLDRVEVEIVNLDVVVTDPSGQPLDGLTRDDFVLRVDGRPTPIENFYAVGREAAAAPAPAAAAGSAAPPPAAPDELPLLEQELHLVVLFDNLHAEPGERKRVAEDLAAAFEDGLGVRGRAAVASYDGHIRIRQPFTADGAALAAAIRELGESQVGFSDDFDRRNLLKEIEQVRLNRLAVEGGDAQVDAWGVLRSIEVYAQRQNLDARRRLAALGAQADALAGLPGRKVMLFVTSGLDLRPGQALFAAWNNKFAGITRGDGGAFAVPRASNLQIAAGELELGKELLELTRRANAAGVALYAVGTAGTGTKDSLSAESPGFDVESIGVLARSPGRGRTYDQTVEITSAANLGSGLEAMAHATGGDALTGAPAYDQIATRIEQDAGHRYSLGFRAPEGEPGTSHQVEVGLAGYKARLRYRREFTTVTSAQRAAERTRAALLWDHADNGLAVAADFGPTRPSDHGEDYVVLPVLVKVPFVNLVLLPERQLHRGRITIFVVAEDGKGRTSPVQTIEAPIEVPAARLAEALRGVAGYRVSLVVRPGPHRLAIGVRDDVGDVVSSVVLEHQVEAPAGKARAKASR